MQGNDKLGFRVNTKSPISVYMQIENHVQFAIASGRLKSGESLPSVRDLSETLDVNPNTVTKALRDLELKGLVTTRRGIGFQVASNARARCKSGIHEMVKQHLRDAVIACAAAGLTKAQVKKLVAGALASNHRPYAE